MFKNSTRSNKSRPNKPLSIDAIYYPELHERSVDNIFRSSSVDKITNSKTEDRQGYVLTCHHSDEKACSENKKPVNSNCIDSCTQLTAQAFLMPPFKSEDFDHYLSGHYRHPHFFESNHSIQVYTIGLGYSNSYIIFLQQKIYRLTKRRFYICLKKRMQEHNN